MSDSIPTSVLYQGCSDYVAEYANAGGGGHMNPSQQIIFLHVLNKTCSSGEFEPIRENSKLRADRFPLYQRFYLFTTFVNCK